MTLYTQLFMNMLVLLVVILIFLNLGNQMYNWRQNNLFCKYNAQLDLNIIRTALTWESSDGELINSGYAVPHTEANTTTFPIFETVEDYLVFLEFGNSDGKS